MLPVRAAAKHTVPIKKTFKKEAKKKAHNKKAKHTHTVRVQGVAKGHAHHYSKFAKALEEQTVVMVCALPLSCTVQPSLAKI